MDERRRERLDGIGFQWTSPPIAARYAELCEYRKLHGTCRVKGNVNRRLAQWAYGQKRQAKRGVLSLEKRKKLESIGFALELSNE